MPNKSPAAASGAGVNFAPSLGFQVELKRRVDAYFRACGAQQQDGRELYLKTIATIALFGACYSLLVFSARTWWEAAPLAVVLGLAASSIGFNIQHDGSHQAYSRHRWINKLASMSLDMIGGSSYIWRWKHVLLHHTYPNISGHDADIDIGIIGRLTPHQKRYPFHRWQHFYLWPLYGFMAVRWQLYGDFRDIISGSIGEQKIPRPKGWDMVGVIAGKLAFLVLAFGVPLLFHSLGVVLAFYGLTVAVVGIALSIIFQLAHCVEEAEFPMPDPDTQRMENAWAIHQVETTVDFARRNKLAAWLLGGLNFQVEHHLFPRISHIHYPALSRVVEETCREFGVKYQEHKSFWAGIVSHFRWLREMGRAGPDGTS